MPKFCFFFFRINFAVTIFDSKIYAIGGEGLKGAIIQTVEAYDPTIDRWKEIGTIPKPRRNHATCTINDKLWSCGGTSSLLEAQSIDELMLVHKIYLNIYFSSLVIVLLIQIQMNGNVH